jgi:hypothetical protein
MFRIPLLVYCLLLTACHRPPPAAAINPEPVAEKIPICDSDKEIADIRAIARKYIPTITDPSAHQLSSEISYKAMFAEFGSMTASMGQYQQSVCWARIKLEIDLARIDAAKARGEKL